MPQVDRLTAAKDQSNATLWTFANGTEFDQPLTRPTATTPVAWVDYGFNPLGTRPAAIGPTTLAWSFLYRYDGTYADWSALQSGLTKAFGHGRTIVLEKTDASGVTWDCDAICTSLPRKADTDSVVLAKFTLAFEQRSSWRSPFVIGTALYDDVSLYDDGVFYDSGGVQFTLAGALNAQFTLTNGGNATEYDVQINLQGPIPGPFTIYNLALDARGQPAPAGTPAANLMQVYIATTLASGEIMTFLCRTGEVGISRPGVAAWALASRAKGQIPYFAVGPGANLCQVSVAATSPTGGLLDFRFRDRNV